MTTTVNDYQVGQVPRLSVTIGEGVDPTALTFRIRVGNGTPTVYTYNTDAQLKRDAAGSYYVDWTIAQEGVHYYRWAGTGTAAGAIEHSFRVDDSAFFPI